MKIKNLALVAFCLIAIISACSPIQPTREPAASNQLSPISPISPLPTPLEAVTTDSKGAIRGILMHTSEKCGDVPVDSKILALAEILTNKDGEPRVAGYDPSTAPFTVTDEQGRFVLNQVRPGLYGLMLDVVTDVMLLDNPSDMERTLFIEVVAGELVDLTADIGVLKYEVLPIKKFMDCASE